MQKHEADYTSVFRLLCDAVHPGSNVEGLTKIFSGDLLWVNWLELWRKKLEMGKRTLEQVAQGMRSVNPAFIPRNHLVEQAISSAVEKNDFSAMYTMQKLLSTPYLDQPSYQKYLDPPKKEERIFKTFCGT